MSEKTTKPEGEEVLELTDGQKSELTIQKSIDKQYKLLELKHGKGNVFVIRVDDKVGYLGKPNRAIYGKAMGHMTPIPGMKNDPDPLKAGIALLVGCWLDGGDDEIKTADEYLIPAAMSALALLEMKTASLTKK